MINVLKNKLNVKNVKKNKLTYKSSMKILLFVKN